MPSRNVVKEFEPDAMYHIYNRGVEKRIIFQDERDYAVFLSFLKYALLSDDNQQHEEAINARLLTDAERFNLRRLGLASQVDLVSFCLMPSHFHLLLYQRSEDAITRLMRSIATGYVMYFNKRYKRVGSLFQGVYRASRISDDAYWLQISRYMHLNPLDITNDYKNYPYSSYRIYSGEVHAEWVKPDYILGSFKNFIEYQKFVDEYIPKRNELEELKSQLADA